MKDNSSNKRIGLHEVAIAAGVSRMTVSLALRNHHSLPPATRTRIQAIAKQLGYQPDPDMGKLMEKMRERKKRRLPSIIAYITSNETRHGWKSFSTQASYYHGAYDRAMECGYQLEEFWLREPKMNARRLCEILRNRYIEGALIAPLPRSQALDDGFRWDYFSAVQLGYSILNPNLYRCCNHQFQSMMLLVQKLQQAGYREIGLAMPASQDERVNHSWRAAYLASQSLISTANSIPMLLSPDFDKKQFVRWFSAYRPEAIVTIGPDVQKWLAELKVKVPRDVGLADVDLPRDMRGMTGINQNSTAVGAAAVDLLITLMRTNETGFSPISKILMVEGTFVQGATTLPFRNH